MAIAAPDTEQSTTFTEARAAGEALARFVADLEIDRFSVGDSLTLARFFTTVERTAQAGKAQALARAARAEVHHSTAHRSAAEALAAATGDSVGETKDMVQLAENLAKQPELDRAFRDGALSRRRATMVSNAVKDNPAEESKLVEAARGDTDAQLKERCLRSRAAARTKAEEQRHHQKLHDERTARTWTDDDGALCLRARFAPEAGAQLKATLEAQADRQFDQARHEGRSERSDAYRADALMALVTGKGILGHDAAASTKPRRPGAADVPDSTGSGTDGDDPGGPTGRTPDPKVTVSVVVDLDALRRGHMGEGERCEIPGVGPVSVEYVRSLLGEALVELLIAKGTDVTTVYSAGRHVPRRVRSALLLRDPRCVVPGCDARLGLENDHWVTDFAKGGLTSLDNLARLCRRHHRDRTHHGFTLAKEGDTWSWVAPEHPFTPKRPRTKRRPRSQGLPKGPPADPGPPLFDEDALPLRE